MLENSSHHPTLFAAVLLGVWLQSHTSAAPTNIIQGATIPMPPYPAALLRASVLSEARQCFQKGASAFRSAPVLSEGRQCFQKRASAFRSAPVLSEARQCFQKRECFQKRQCFQTRVWRGARVCDRLRHPTATT